MATLRNSFHDHVFDRGARLELKTSEQPPKLTAGLCAHYFGLATRTIIPSQFSALLFRRVKHGVAARKATLRRSAIASMADRMADRPPSDLAIETRVETCSVCTLVAVRRT